MKLLKLIFICRPKSTKRKYAVNGGRMPETEFQKLMQILNQ